MKNLWLDPLTWIILVVCVAGMVMSARSRDDVVWDSVQSSPEISKWYRELMQPDNPSVSCCGESDAYWADSFEVLDGKYVAIITDTRDGNAIGRPHIPPGTKIVVPNHKLKFDRGNPTGHGVIFVNTTLDVYCYVVPGGV